MRNAALALSLLLASCVSPAAGAGSVNVSGAWKLDSMAGAPVLSGTNPTLTFTTDGHINGNGGCNGFGGDYARDGDTLTFSHIISTMMACTRPGLTYEQVMGQEHRFLSALNGAVRASAPETNVLVITTPSGDALRFVRGP